MIVAVAYERIFQELIAKTYMREDNDCLFATSGETLAFALRKVLPEVIFLDLGISSLDGPLMIQNIKQNPSTRAIPIVAFGNSLRSDLLQDAREAGVDLVLPKPPLGNNCPN